MNHPSAAKRRVAIIDTSDFAGFPMGGATKVIEGYLADRRASGCDIHLFGLTRARDERVGRTYDRVIAGRRFPFTPVARVFSSGHDRPLLPLRIQFLLGACMGRRFLAKYAPHVVYIHQPEGLPLILSQSALTAVHFHTVVEKDMRYARYALGRAALVRPLIHVIEWLLLSSADIVMSVDADAMLTYVGRYPAVRDRFYVVPPRPSLVSGDRSTRPFWGGSGDMPVLLFVGRLSRRKGLDLMYATIDALESQGHHCHLMIVGDGEDRAKLQRWMTKTKAKVTYVGYVPHADLGDFYANADVTLFPSEYDSFGLVVLESLASGTPVVAAPTGIAPDILDGQNGVVVTERSPKAFGDAVLKVLRLGEGARQQALSSYRKYANNSLHPFDLFNSHRCDK